jgi:hypothetical protein
MNAGLHFEIERGVYNCTNHSITPTINSQESFLMSQYESYIQWKV